VEQPLLLIISLLLEGEAAAEVFLSVDLAQEPEDF
jgi:hypothetical protein